MRTPRSTYRLQLGEGFGFAAVRRVVPYLRDLGISDVYLSPIARARTGSPHGYDVVDPTTLNPALGSRDDFDALASAVADGGMGLIVDIVPNHMAASHENPWWWDVLRRGPDSPYAHFFDIDWGRGEGKLVLPVLGASISELLRRKALRLSGDTLVYGDRRFPLRDVRPREPLAELLGRQAYRLVHWRTGERLLNYRRFFDITDLVGVRIEEPEVFEATHALWIQLTRAGLVTGLRIDHVDGLRDPEGYLRRLSESVPPETYLVVEKILSRGEEEPSSWPVAGTTGYEVAATVDGVFVDPRGVQRTERFARRFAGLPSSFEDVVYASKRHVAHHLFPGEIDGLTARLADLSPHLGDLPFAELRSAVVEITAALDVYRTYITGSPPSATDRRRLRAAHRAARDRVRNRRAVDELARVLRAEADDRPERLDLVARWQQLTGALMAKGHEDTAAYRFPTLVSRNEVGADPGRPATSTDDLHALSSRRARIRPRAMSASTTHDSKRSEDVRARIDVLAQMPGRWEERARRWSVLNAGLKSVVKGKPAPSPPDELLLYQTLVGAWPLTPSGAKGFTRRIRDYMLKAVREAKVNSSWRDPGAAYETATDRFVGRVLARPNAAFRGDLERFANSVGRAGAVDSLARLVLKLTAPGVPDFYQGTELWHLRLVDPDNRGPVDFELMRSLLAAMTTEAERDLGRLATRLLRSWTDGRIKLYVTWRGLDVRRRYPDVFASGSYRPLAPTGGRGENVVALARSKGRRWVIACVPRLCADVEDWPIGSVWTGTTLTLPRGAPRAWRSVLTDDRVRAEGGTLDVAEVLRDLPVGLLVNAGGRDE